MLISTITSQNEQSFVVVRSHENSYDVQRNSRNVYNIINTCWTFYLLLHNFKSQVPNLPARNAYTQTMEFITHANVHKDASRISFRPSRLNGPRKFNGPPSLLCSIFAFEEHYITIFDGTKKKEGNANFRIEHLTDSHLAICWYAKDGTRRGQEWG